MYYVIYYISLTFYLKKYFGFKYQLRACGSGGPRERRKSVHFSNQWLYGQPDTLIHRVRMNLEKG